MEHKLRALYYPFSRCLDAETLKRAVLYFDELWFLDPLNPDQCDNALSAAPSKGSEFSLDSVLTRWPSIRDDYVFLAEKGITRFLDPRPLLNRWDRLYLAALQSDLSDDTFIKLAFTAGPMVWHMLRSKMPPSIFSMIEPRGISFDEAMGWLELLYTDHPREVFGMAKPFGEYAKYFASGLITGEGDVYSLSYPQGASLNLTQALLVADQEGVGLFTDHDVHHSLLLNRFRRASAHPEITSVRRIITRATPAELLRHQLVAVNVMEAALPSTSLTRLSIQDCVRLREEAQGELERFRTLVAGVSAEIERSPWDQEFEQAMRKAIATKIMPELKKLEDGLGNVYTNLFGRLAKKAVGGMVGGGASLVAAVVGGLPPFALLTLSCTALATVMGVTAVELIEGVLQEKRLSQNAVHYLLRLKHMC